MSAIHSQTKEENRVSSSSIDYNLTIITVRLSVLPSCSAFTNNRFAISVAGISADSERVR